MNPALIELHVPDFSPIRDFYGKLGFSISWERTPEDQKGYLVLSLEDNILCFWGGNDQIYSQTYFKEFSRETPRGFAVEIVIQVSDIHSFYKGAVSEFKIHEPLCMRPWGLEDFRLLDPFGFYLRFTSKHEIRDPKFAIK